MKKCAMMFGLLLLTLMVAVLTEKKQETVILETLAMSEKSSDEIVFEQTRTGQNEKTEND